MGGGLESRYVGRVYGADGAVRLAHHPHRTHEIATESFIISSSSLELHV